MRRYDDFILGKILDKYERSSASKGGSRRNMEISYKLDRKDIPEYFDVSRMDFDILHSQLRELENAGLLRLVWKKKHEGQILEKCVLVCGNVTEAYRRLGRTPKSEKETEILGIIRKYEDQMPAFAKWVEERISQGNSVKQYLDMDDSKQAERICYLASRILQNRSEVFLRQFSISCFHDSKIAERDISAATRILSDFECDGRLKGLDAEEVLEECLIFRNPSWIMMKGGPWIDTFPGGIGITDEDALKVKWDALSVITCVLTIENLTTFHQWKGFGFSEPVSGGGIGAILDGGMELDGETLVIYLGGYANRSKREFLLRIHEAYPAAKFFHYGDIDCGGFRIWKNLSESTGLTITPCRMDLDTYREYKKWGRTLTEHDRVLLRKMMEDPFYEDQRELFGEMLRDGRKLEQEVIG